MDGRIETIVVGVASVQARDSGSKDNGDDPVLQPALELARRLGARLHVVQVMEARDPVLGAYTHALHSSAELEQRQHGALQQLEARVQGFAYEAVRCHTLAGPADRALCRFAEEADADLLIMGATRRGWLWRNVLGSTAERVLKRSSVPVLVLRRPFREEANRVLFTTDLSAASGAVIESGLDVVRALLSPAPLELRTLLACGYTSTMLQHLPPETMLADAARKLGQFLVRLATGDARLEPRLRTGNPSQQIIREAAEWPADLLVLGTHSRLGVARWLLGSTAAATLRTTGSNTLVIPTRFASTRRRGLAAPEHGYPGTEEHRPSDPPQRVTA